MRSKRHTGLVRRLGRGDLGDGGEFVNDHGVSRAASIHWFHWSAMQFGDVATWVASVGTVAAVSVALWQVMTDRRARTRREIREHASQIAAWSSGYDPRPGLARDHPLFRVGLQNSSSEPVYEVVVFQVFIQGAAPKTGEEMMGVERRTFGDDAPMYSPRVVLGVLPPGRWDVTMTNVDVGILGGREGIEIGFTDRNGLHWIRRATGTLQKIPINAIDHYKIDRPIDYRRAVEPGGTDQ